MNKYLFQKGKNNSEGSKNNLAEQEHPQIVHVYEPEYYYSFRKTSLRSCTELFEIIVGVLTTYTQYTSDSSICEQHVVTFLTGALYVHPL